MTFMCWVSDILGHVGLVMAWGNISNIKDIIGGLSINGKVERCDQGEQI